MKLFALASIVATAAAAADPQITPRAELQARQNDPALLGYVSASTYSDLRSCDFPATLSRSGNLAQCCGSSSCIFWSSCSAGTLFASQTSLFCDQGYCNTAVLVSTPGASNGQNYLGCWATSLGQSAFTIVRDIGSAPVAGATSAAGSGGSSARVTGSAASRASSAAGAASSAAASAASSAASAARSSGAASAVGVQQYSGLVGLVAVFLGIM